MPGTKLKLKTRAQLALAFTKKLGVNVESLVLRDEQTDVLSSLPLNGNQSQTGALPTATQVYSTKLTAEVPELVHAPRLEKARERHSKSPAILLYRQQNYLVVQSDGVQ